MHTLIVGGTSGLGLALGQALHAKGHVVRATGRREPQAPGIVRIPFDITANTTLLRAELDTLVKALPHIDLMVYAAGYCEHGHINSLTDTHITRMVNVGIVAPAMLLQRVLHKQGTLPGLIAITSTSQWIAREYEPLYCATKAGLAHMAHALSLDPAIGKTLVVGPAGMQTAFWDNTPKRTDNLLPAPTVAHEIMQLWEGAYRYRLARILRDPLRTEVLETRI